MVDVTIIGAGLAGLGFRVAQTALARRAVRHLFFGRGSIPEVTLPPVAAARRRA